MGIDQRSANRSHKETARVLYFWIMGLIAFIVGLLLVIASEGLTPELFSHVVRDIGISFLVASVVGFGVDLYARIEGEERLRRVLTPDGIRSLGIKEVYADRLKLDFLGYVRATRPGSEIRLLGISMNRLANLEAQSVIKEKLQANCKIKILLMDASAEDELERRALAEGIEDLQEFKQESVRWIQSHQGFIHSLPSQLRERIELRLYRSAPDYFIVDNDRTMLLSFYLRSYRGEDAPHLEMEIKHGGAFSPFRDHFERLWANSAAVVAVTTADRRRQQTPVEMDRRRGERRRHGTAVTPDRRQRKSA